MQALPEEELPPHLNLLDEFCLKRQDMHEKIQFFDEIGNYYQNMEECENDDTPIAAAHYPSALSQ